MLFENTACGPGVHKGVGGYVLFNTCFAMLLACALWYYHNYVKRGTIMLLDFGTQASAKPWTGVPTHMFKNHNTRA